MTTKSPTQNKIKQKDCYYDQIESIQGIHDGLIKENHQAR